MTPTNKLRFVERTVSVPVNGYDDIAEYKTFRVLQQWFAFDPSDYEAIMLEANGEWRDVPLGVEE